MGNYSLVRVDYQPDFGDFSLVPVDYDPFAGDNAAQQWQAQQGQAQAPPSQQAQNQQGQTQQTQRQPAQGAHPAPQDQTSSPASGQPNNPSAVPISAPDQPALANQRQPGNISALGSAGGGNGPSFGKSLLQGVVNTVPGAYYAGLAQEQFRRGNYGAAAIYEALAFGDAALGAATLGASTRLGAGVRAAETALAVGNQGAGRAAGVIAKGTVPVAAEEAGAGVRSEIGGIESGGPPAASFSGSRRNPLQAPEGPPRNSPGEFDGRPFSGHTFDQLQNRGLPPTIVDDVIKNGIPSPGNRPGTTRFYDPSNNISLLLEMIPRVTSSQSVLEIRHPCLNTTNVNIDSC